MWQPVSWVCQFVYRLWISHKGIPVAGWGVACLNEVLLFQISNLADLKKLSVWVHYHSREKAKAAEAASLASGM